MLRGLVSTGEYPWKYKSDVASTDLQNSRLRALYRTGRSQEYIASSAQFSKNVARSSVQSYRKSYLFVLRLKTKSRRSEFLSKVVLVGKWEKGMSRRVFEYADRGLSIEFSRFLLLFNLFFFCFCYRRSSWRKPRWSKRSGRIFVRRLPRTDRADFASGLSLLLDERHVFGSVSPRYYVVGTWCSTKIIW